MKENMMDILMYLFEHCLDSETGVMPEESVLRGHLDDAGFQLREIEKAFVWLEELANAREHTFQDQLSSDHVGRSIRIYAEQEQARLDRECRGFMQFLEQTGVLDPVNRELVIDRAMALESGEIDLPQLKWVILMVLFNQPGQEAALAWMEDLLFDGISEHLH
jgi:Smg protein